MTLGAHVTIDGYLFMTSPNTERETRRRRRYAPSFKAKIVAACLQGDTSIAQVALQHGLNTNLVQTWIRKAKRQSQLPAVPDFVPAGAASRGQPANTALHRWRDLHRAALITGHDHRAPAVVPGRLPWARFWPTCPFSTPCKPQRRSPTQHQLRCEIEQKG